MINELVSVIVPVYNVRQYLPESIDSVLNQTYKKLEIIIIDDGSTDGSGELCDEYAMKDERIKVIHQENKGLSAARNVGLDVISGYAVAFLDSDDVYEKFFIEKLFTTMVRESVDIVVCKYTFFCQVQGRKNNKETRVYPFGISDTYNHSEGLSALVDGTINVSIWNKLYRKDLWTTIRFPNGKIYEDLDTTYRIFNLCKGCTVIDEILYYHRKRAGSITSFNSPNNICDKITARSHFSEFIEAHVPDIFTNEQARKWNQDTLKEMIESYIGYSKITRRDEKGFFRELRHFIIFSGKQSGVEMLQFRIKIAWFMICVSPGLLRVIYTVYVFFDRYFEPLKSIDKKRMGRQNK